MAGDTSEEDGTGTGEVKSSTALQGDLDGIKEKIGKYQSRRELAQHPEVKSHGDAVVECYKCVNRSLTPLSAFTHQHTDKTLLGLSIAGGRLTSLRTLWRN